MVEWYVKEWTAGGRGLKVAMRPLLTFLSSSNKQTDLGNKPAKFFGWKSHTLFPPQNY
jgi:hypothetical protein